MKVLFLNHWHTHIYIQTTKFKNHISIQFSFLVTTPTFKSTEEHMVNA